MSILNDFDSAIAQEENLERGFQTEKGFYVSYLSNNAWNIWLKEMKEEHREQFGKGSGGELEEKNGRPPKMASFASSSRMTYRLSKDFPGCCFEKQLPTKVGGIANLDGYWDCADAYIFIEAKCREPYSHNAVQVIRNKYKPLYEYIQKKMQGNFDCEMENIPDSRDMRVKFYCNNEPVVYFDIKQMICHMLGIANEMLIGGVNKPILFLYLLYNPSALQLPEESGVEIMKIYKDTCRTALAYEMEAMFGYIVEYLISEKKAESSGGTAEQVKGNFRFVLTDQNTYRNILSGGYTDLFE